MEFTRWSNLNPNAKKVLAPNLGVRSWDEITIETKQLILKHFENSEWFGPDKDICEAVLKFDRDHRAGDHCRHLLGHGGPHYYEDHHGYGRSRKECCNQPAYMDLQNICLRRGQDATYELISYYAEVLKSQTYNNKFERFCRFFNSMAEQFGLNVVLNNDGFVLRQDKKIDDHIYEPVLNFLANKKWEPVNRDLADAFHDYLKNTPEGYSSCITHAISGLQAFLQIVVNGDVGSGDIAPLLKTALGRNLIPGDPFSEKIFKDAISILMQERQEKGDPHPKSEYANQKSARLVLNLIMVFLQHAIQEQ